MLFERVYRTAGLHGTISKSAGAVSSCIPSIESKNDGNSAKNIFKKIHTRDGP